MNKATPYIVSFVAALLCVGVFVFSGFRWEDRSPAWGFIFSISAFIWAAITTVAFADCSHK